MNIKNLGLKFFIVALLLVLCVYSLTTSGLKQGIDLRGGHSLIYEIRTNEQERQRLVDRTEELQKRLDEAADEPQRQRIEQQIQRVEQRLQRIGDQAPSGDLAQRMIAVLKRRVDPEGLRALEWRPLSANRIEIRMPAGDPESAQQREAYFQSLDRLEQNNIQRSEVRAVLQADPARRDEMIRRLIQGDEQQIERFHEVLDASGEMQRAARDLQEVRAAMRRALAAETQPANLDALQQSVQEAQNAYDNASIAYEQQLRALDDFNISRQRVMAILDNYVSPQESEAMTQDAVEKRMEIFRRELATLKEEHPARVDEIDAVVDAYQEWARGRQRLDDPSDLKRLITKAGVLEFRIAPYRPAVGGPYALSEQEMARALESFNTEGPEGLARRNAEYQWFPVRDDDRGYGRAVTRDFAGQPYLLLSNRPKETMLHEAGPGGWQLDSAKPDRGRRGEPAVAFTLDQAGEQRFYALTQAHQGDPDIQDDGAMMAILLDDEVYSAPQIQTAISGSGIITMPGATRDEVDDLVRTLQAGSLPARLNPDPVAENTFGPAIGAVNRERGIQAATWGLIIVAVFMLIYYLLPGAIAVVALVLNIILVLGTMSLIGAVFTLPGIAGIILTIGIAVDANVLIFERLREEQAKGQSIRMAVKNAYERAFSAIFDANITTLLVCIILGWFGTEEVRGFAITLGLGVTFSLFTALAVTRWIFQLLLNVGVIKKPLHMMRFVGIPTVNWMSKRYIFWGVSVVLVALGIMALVGQGGDVLGIEFSAGTQADVVLRDGTLIDGELPDDALVRERFISQADELGHEKLEATALVETQLNPDRVESFIQDYDSDENPDGVVSREEWMRRRPNQISQQQAGAWFAAIDADGDASLVREELQEDLPPSTYQITTTETHLPAIRETALAAFGQRLRIRAPRDFEIVSGEEVEPLGVRIPADGRVRLTRELRQQIRPSFREDFINFEDGTLFVIQNVSPPITPTELAQRMRSLRYQPDFADVRDGSAKVIGLTRGATEGEYTSLAVLVRPGSEDAFDRPGAWDRFSAGERGLLSAALEKEEAMNARNFDKAIAGQAAWRGGFAILGSWLAIVAYLWFRFGNWRWGLAAVVCLVHDVVIVVGLVAASKWLAASPIGAALGIQSFKIDLAMVAAILTVIGYSVNDTIVVFDRIRENRGKLATVSPLVINTSINQTLARTLLTSGTTLIVVLTMYLIGGAGIHPFSYALLMGILFGTYSSIAVASPLLMGFRRALVARTAGAVPDQQS